MYKIIYFSKMDDIMIISKNDIWYYYNMINNSLNNLKYNKEYREYALGAEEFAKKWLEHNKEYL